MGGSGNDTITGDGGNDLILGNEGYDDLSGNNGNDTIYGRSGNDIINGNEGDDYISGGSGNDTIIAGEGNDIIYGNNGVDVIDGAEGNDYIYGGAGDDVITAGDGNDYIYGGSGNNTISADQGDDYIVGGEDYDNIDGGDGDDTIISRSGADRIDGGAGDDSISAGAGNDILIDGIGSDNLVGGADNDIFIITKQNTDDNNQLVTDIDVIEDFNKDEDRIIIKVDYQNPITFATLQNYLSQNGSDAEINLSNGQQIIIKNTNISDLTTSNLAIGLSGGQDNDILFGTDNNDILFGNLGDDQLYGGEGNDELFGEKGSDALYGQDGDDMLYYEADGRFLSNNQKTLVGYKKSSYTYNNNLRDYHEEEDIAFKHDDESDSSYNYLYRWTTKHRRGRWGGHYHRYHSKVIYDNKYDFKHYFTKNFYNSEDININGYNRSFDSFKGGEGTDTLLLTGGNDMLALDDNTSNNPDANNSRLQDIEIIYANDGDDIINLTSPNYTNGDITIYGGQGNDRIWSSIGDDILLGQDGNDEIYGYDGKDYIIGGDGDDILIGGKGDDIIEGGNGDDQISGNEGDDIIEGGAGADNLDGGAGNNTISYITSQEGVNIDIKNNTASGGDAQGDVISNFDNVIGSNKNDNIIGNDNANIIEGKQGDDTLKGGLGSDTYIYNIGDGDDIIDDQDQYLGDVIKFAESINRSDLFFSESWNDLVIHFLNNDNDSITIKNQLIDNPKINFIEFANGDKAIDLSNKSYITQEDITYEVDLSQLEQEKIYQQNITLIALYGSAIYNEDTGLISYTSNSNFNGIDELTYNITDDNGNIIRSSTLNMMVSPINDNPFGTVDNQEIMVDQEFTLNLNDFFSDVDGDNLTYLVNVKIK